MPHPMNDVIVVLPGIMGSTLYRDNKPVWEPSKGAVVNALRSLLRSVKTLRLPDGIGDDHPDDGVAPRALMPDYRLPFGVWTFDFGYTALLDFLRSKFDVVESAAGSDRPANLISFPYDWRLSNRYNGALLRDTVEPALERWRAQGGEHADAKLVFITHSMGGLVARWYLDHLGGGKVTDKLITLGTPHRGALNALDQLSNGVRKGIGPFKINLTGFARSLPSTYQLLPEYACVEREAELAKTTEVDLPDLETARTRDAMEFHTQIDEGRKKGTGPEYELHPIIGFEQPTWTTARLDKGRVVGVRTIKKKDERGDATVPRLSSAPPDVKSTSAIIKHIADNHGGLVHNRGVFDEIEGILTATDITHRGVNIRIAVETEEVLDPGESPVVRATLPDKDRVALEVVITDTASKPIDTVQMVKDGAALRAAPSLPGPGLYRLTVRGAGAALAQVVPVTTAVLAWPPEAEFDAEELRST